MRAFFLLMAVTLASAMGVRSQTVVWYVDASATGTETGLSWADAFTDLQDALAVAGAGDEVWVAEGTYKPTAGTDRAATFILRSGVALYGGFEGTEQTHDQRDWVRHRTILSGEIGVPNQTTDNSCHAVTVSPLATPGGTTTAVLDGVVVTRGHAENCAEGGGGILLPGGSSPVIANCEVVDNRGSGINAMPGSALIMRDCLLTLNFSEEGGGACAWTVRACAWSGSSSGETRPRVRRAGAYTSATPTSSAGTARSKGTAPRPVRA
ncbi:MAG TPA: right-handed parallel beta-helix repeat-containing protein [Rubricoccaceae bacterium]|nr:right-handed parallel beta-helix repeat-containing protein [Rubricoccaceae bacterium]